MPYTLNDAYNLMLRSNGEQQKATFENIKDIQASKVIPILEAILREQLRIGYNFNTFEITLQPTTQGVINVPDNYLNVYFPLGLAQNLVLRNNVVWDRCANIPYSQELRACITIYQSFPETPELFRQMIAYLATLDYYANYGPGPGTANYGRLEQRSKMANSAFFNSEFYLLPKRYESLYAMGQDSVYGFN